MYLSDHDIRARLQDFRFATDDPNLPFDPDSQIQPCTVDIRLDSTFWRQRRRKTIDLRRSKLLELSPRRYWSKTTLSPGETISLKPGDLVLGRTFESFALPRDCAGKLEGRSSFGRMGLSVHCTNDFINPGWSGHMPLELVNVGRHTLQLFAHIPICQVGFVPLTSKPDRTYGDRSLFSKYMNDDGGPSFWWRDRRIEQLHVSLSEHDVSTRVQREILDWLGPCEPELIERFEIMVSRLRQADTTNATDLLERFAKSEDRHILWSKVARTTMLGLLPLFAAASLAGLVLPPLDMADYILWALTAASVPIGIWGLKWDYGEHLGSRDLEARRRSREQAQPKPIE